MEVRISDAHSVNIDCYLLQYFLRFCFAEKIIMLLKLQGLQNPECIKHTKKGNVK